MKINPVRLKYYKDANNLYYISLSNFRQHRFKTLKELRKYLDNNYTRYFVLIKGWNKMTKKEYEVLKTHKRYKYFSNYSVSQLLYLKRGKYYNKEDKKYIDAALYSKK